MTKQWQILRLIAKAGAQGINAEALERELYADDPDGGPMCARQSILVMVHKLRRRGYVYSMGRTWQARYYHVNFNERARVVSLAADIMRANTDEQFAAACNKMKATLGEAA